MRKCIYVETNFRFTLYLKLKMIPAKFIAKKYWKYSISLYTIYTYGDPLNVNLSYRGGISWQRVFSPDKVCLFTVAEKIRYSFICKIEFGNNLYNFISFGIFTWN